ncbi:LamG-like jellyroll fold domain-containing protein [Flavobacterium sp. WC2409]|uniref:LamG-like jellyroll fold domain-containing protein n=1 Tax=Flavobacterium sp. WC2409 TaxID=3234139 RepID=A0AB39W880_9FLAO
MKFYKKIFYFFLIFVISQGYAQNSLDVLGLDNTTPAAVAYSLRKLSSSYVGDAIQVRRSNDNATQGISFDGNGDLDTASLLAFVGANDGFVTIWYDQSGNGKNAVQNILLNQPKIITAGVIERSNGLPSIIFSGSQFLVVTSTMFNNDLTGCLVYKASSLNTRSGGGGSWYNMNGIFGSEQPGGTTDFAYGIYNNKFTAGNGPSDKSLGGNAAVNDNVIRIHSWTRNSINGQMNLYANSASDGTVNLNTGTSSAVTSVAIGANQTFSGGQVFYNGNVSELILFAAVLANPRQKIENNQGNYYSICLLDTQPNSNNQSVVLGGSPTTLSVLSNDPTATYQWYSNNIKSNSGGTLLSGETNNNYTPSATNEGTLYYYAIISTATITCSSNVSGYVRVGIEITSQPSTSNQTVIQNNTVNSLSVVATGSSITYQWYKNVSKTNTGGTLITGATNNSYTPDSTDLGTNYYYVVISGNNTVLVSNPSGAIKITTNPIIWNGNIITFSKADYANYNLVQNQDVLTNTVKITRADDQGLFNIAAESRFGGSSPSNTEWAEGLLSNYANLTYRTWQQAVNYSPPTSVNKTYVVHLIAENIFLELKFLSWTDSGNGGGFSYSRTTPCTPPSEPIASDQNHNSPATVADLVATGTNIKWYLADTGGSPLQANTTLTSATYYVTQTVSSCESTRKAISVTIISCLSPALSNFNAVNKTYFDGKYTVYQPTSNSSGAFTYTSSNLSVATVSGTTINIISAGSTTITATQDLDGTYCSGSIASILTVNNISVLTKNGELTTSKTNYVNKNGAIGGDFGVDKNGLTIQSKTYDLTTDLVMHLDAGNTASYPGSGTTWTDLSGLGNNGILINNPVYNSSDGGNLVFNGSNTYVNAPLTKTASCTFSVWAKSTNTNSNKMLFNAGNDGAGPDLFFSGNVLSWNTWDSSNNPFGNIPATSANGNWHNYVVVNDAVSNTAKVYYDGVLYGTAVYKNASANTNLYIGGTTGGYQWDGAIGNFQAHNRVLTPAEVAQNFNHFKIRYGL